MMDLIRKYQEKFPCLYGIDLPHVIVFGKIFDKLEMIEKLLRSSGFNDDDMEWLE